MKRKTKKKRKKKEFNLNGYIFGALRKIWRWYPPMRETLAIARVYGTGIKEAYTCAKCDGVVHNKGNKKGVQVDHIDPVVDPKYGFQGWDMYVKRLFVTTKQLQVLCKDCHKKKTNEENKKRRK